jgi:hypothetical protein
MKEHVPPLSPEPHPPTIPEQQAPDGEPRPVPCRLAESPQAFYQRITKREDVRRLLQKLAYSFHPCGCGTYARADHDTRNTGKTEPHIRDA